jgi:hypothetical protein
MMNIFELRARDASSVLIKWILANVLGILLGIGLGTSLGSGFCEELYESFGDTDFIGVLFIFYGFLMIVFSLLAISIFQSIVIRQYIQGLTFISWTGLTIVGWILGITLAFFVDGIIHGYFHPQVSIFIWAIAFGTTIGYFQWRLLKTQLSKANLWILGNSFAWLIAIVVFEWLPAFLRLENILPPLYSVVVFIGFPAVLMSFISGLFLIWIFGQNREILSLSNYGLQDINNE